MEKFLAAEPSHSVYVHKVKLQEDPAPMIRLVCGENEIVLPINTLFVVQRVVNKACNELLKGN